MSVKHLHRTYAAIAIASALAFGVVLLIAREVRAADEQRVQEVFGTLARSRGIALQEHFHEKEQAVAVLKAFFAASHQVERGEFDRFVTAARFEAHGILGAYWLRQSGDGFELAYTHAPRCSPALEAQVVALARRLPNAAATGEVQGGPAPEHLCRAVGGPYLLASAVGAAADTSGGAPARGSRGVVAVALDLGEVLESFLRVRPQAGQQLVLAVVEHGWRRVLYEHRAGALTGDGGEPAWSKELTLGGRPVLLEITPVPGYLESQRSHRAGLVLLIGALVIGGLTAYGVRWSHHRWNLDAVNTELRQLNARLEQEIAQRRQREEELLQTRKMEALGRLAGGIAHDFNNLLGAMRGYAELLTLRLVGAERADAEEIIAAADRAAALTRQLLTFSRRDVVQPRPVDLRRGIEELGRMLQRLLGSHVELATDLAPGLPPVVIDPSHLQQVVLNLAINARDAMPDGGHLLLRTCAGEGGMVELEVTDDGEGMTPEVLERIFEPFFTTKAAEQGTGLGLSTVYGIVAQCGGSIRVDSEPGAGTSFHVLLPAGLEAAAAEEVARPAAPASGAELILLVEDRDEVRRLTSRILRDQGYQVVAVGDPETALARAEELGTAIDLLVSDLGLPQMNGVELARRLRERLPGLRTLFISGYRGDVLGDRGLDPRDLNLLSKPFATGDLLQRVRETIDRPQPLPSAGSDRSLAPA